MPPSRPRHAAMPTGHRGHASFAVIEATERGPRVGRWLTLIVLATGLAIAKPWAGPGAAGDLPAGRVAIARTAAPVPAPSPTPDRYSAGPAVASICMDPPTWRVATVERWHEQTIRVWRAIDTIGVASGPDDERVPVTSLVSEGVLELGWCAPVVVPVLATGDAAVELWRRVPGGAAAVRVTSQRAVSQPSAYGALYGPPAAPRAALWNDGVYVFLHRAPGGRESWFAVDLELRPSVTNRG